MSKRMNKDRAREILKSYLEEYKITLQEYEDKNIPHDKGYIHHKETLQALDIAIDSLEQEKDFYDLLQDRIDYYDDLITKTENLDVRATYCGTYDELIYILNLTKKVEPYERKE